MAEYPVTDDDTVIRIDSHAHVFRRDLPLVARHRHAPQHDALLPELLGLFDHHGITHGVLTAPSFLGSDNSFLLSALAATPGRLRGTVIVDDTCDRAALEEIDRRAEEAARRIAAGAPGAARWHKATLRAIRDGSSATIDRDAVYRSADSSDYHKGLRAFLEKLEPRFGA